MMDHSFTRALQEWLSTPAGERDIPAGALLLLRLDRNRVLYGNILRRPQALASKLEYELEKHLRIRLEGHTLEDVRRMETELLPAIAARLETAAAPASEAPPASPSSSAPEAPEALPAPLRGRHPHHDLFPAPVRELYEKGGVLFQSMKELYHTLLGMETAAPCDRYEYLRQLAQADSAYRKAWEQYDAFAASFDPAHPESSPLPAGLAAASPSGAPSSSSSAPTAKEVSAARKYLSERRSRLRELPPDSPEHASLLAQLQQRVDLILSSGGSFKPDLLSELSDLGLDCSALQS